MKDCFSALAVVERVGRPCHSVCIAPGLASRARVYGVKHEQGSRSADWTYPQVTQIFLDTASRMFGSQLSLRSSGLGAFAHKLQFGPTTVHKETETKNLRNLCNPRIFANEAAGNN
jgi:hypothetical protein